MCWYGRCIVRRCRFFDFDKLREVARVVTANLNKIIDINYYPVETARRSNMRHRPIGIGVQVEPLSSRLSTSKKAGSAGWMPSP